MIQIFTIDLDDVLVYNQCKVNIDSTRVAAVSSMYHGLPATSGEQ